MDFLITNIFKASFYRRELLNEIKFKEDKRGERRTQERSEDCVLKENKNQTNGKFDFTHTLKELKLSVDGKGYCLKPIETVFLSEMVMINAGGKATGLNAICDGKTITLCYSVSLGGGTNGSIIGTKLYTHLLVYATYDLVLGKKNQHQSFYPLNYGISLQKFVNSDIGCTKDKHQYIGLITNGGMFILLKLEISTNSIGNSTEIFRLAPADDKLSCFELRSYPQTSELRLFAGSHSGKVYIYDLKDQARLVMIINPNTNFFIKSVKLYDFSKQQQPYAQPLIAITTLDGYLKIFNLRDPEPLYEFVGAKKPVYDLHWDSNPTLLFFLDESEAKAINVISFNRNPAVTDYAKKLIKNQVALLKLSMDQQSDHFACYCEDGTIRVGVISVS